MKTSILLALALTACALPRATVRLEESRPVTVYEGDALTFVNDSDGPRALSSNCPELKAQLDPGGSVVAVMGDGPKTCRLDSGGEVRVVRLVDPEAFQ